MSTPAPYTIIGTKGVVNGQPTGYWLVAKNGLGAVVNAAHLPAQGHGYQYYWLGATAGAANQVVDGAIEKLDIANPSQAYVDVTKAVSSGYVPVTYGSGTGGLSLAGLLAYGTLGILGAPALAGSGEAAAGEAAAGTGAAEAGAGATAASDIAKAAAVGGLASLITDPSFLYRALKFIGGLLLAYIGIKQLASTGSGGSSTTPAQTVRKLAIA
jgi:hypothetical protein